MEPFPWERRGEIGILRAFWQNLALSVRSPGTFYGLAARDSSYWPAVAYGFLFELANALATFLYDKAIGDAEVTSALTPVYPQLEQMVPGATEHLGAFMNGAALVSLLATPITYVLELHVMAFLTWVGLRLAKGLQTPFGHIVRLLAYAGWVRIFGLLAVSGDLVMSLISALLTIGLASYTWVVLVRASQHIDARRAVIASLYGTLVGLVFGCICAVPPAAALTLWVVSKFAGP